MERPLCFTLQDHDCNLVVYNELVNIFDVLGRWCEEWSEECMVMKTSSITSRKLGTYVSSWMCNTSLAA